MSGLGSLATLMDALVGLEETISPELTVSRWRPVKVDPPHLYNWLIPSPADIPAIGIVEDTLNLSVRILVAQSDIEEQTAAIETYWDLARDVIDADLIRPAQSVLRTSAHYAKRKSMRSIQDVFNDVLFLGLELTLELHLRRGF